MDQTHSSRSPKPSEPLQEIEAEAIEALDRELLLLGLMMASPSRRVRHSPARRRVATSLIALASATNVVSLALLCRLLVEGAKTNGKPLIFAGVVL
jgi:hypothetical protein